MLHIVANGLLLRATGPVHSVQTHIPVKRTKTSHDKAVSLFIPGSPIPRQPTIHPQLSVPPRHTIIDDSMTPSLLAINDLLSKEWCLRAAKGIDQAGLKCYRSVVMGAERLRQPTSDNRGSSGYPDQHSVLS